MQLYPAAIHSQHSSHCIEVSKEHTTSPWIFSQLITILGTQIAHLGLLVLGQPYIRRRTVSRPVLPATRDEIQDTGSDAEDRKGKT